MKKNDYKIKRLYMADWPDLKAIRLEALKQDPQFFLRRYEDDRLEGDAFWQKSFADAALVDRALFGLYDGNKIIGMGGVSPDQDYKNAARLGGGYISKAYRGQGLAHVLISARIDWAKANPAYDCIYLSHRRGNKPSQAVAEKAGFQYVMDKNIQWPDGQNDAEWIYVLKF